MVLGSFTFKVLRAVQVLRYQEILNFLLQASLLFSVCVSLDDLSVAPCQMLFRTTAE